MKLDQLSVKFEHLTYEKSQINKKTSEQKMVHVPYATKVTICNTENVRIAVGTAIVGENDSYDKKFGRKLSLKRALNSLSLPKEIRTNIWKQYHEQTNNSSRVKSFSPKK